MKIVLAGGWGSQLHEAPAARALTELGHEVVRFAWNDFFVAQNSSGLRYPAEMSARLQNKYLWGPRFDRLNRALLDTIRRSRPDVLFVYLGTHVTRRAIEEARKLHPGLFVVGACNDDPFSPKQRPALWRHFVGALPAYDLILAYRESNVAEFIRAGARRVRVMRSWFVPWCHRPVQLSERERAAYGCDVVFVGHHEDDGRLEMLEALQAEGVRLRLFGPYRGFGTYGWEGALARSRVLRHLAPTSLVWGDDYAKALSGAKIALCFLSKLNRDTYTRRCFEIPATGTLLLSERTDDLRTLFREGHEADFFSDSDELRRKVRHYLRDDQSRSEVAAAGMRRVAADGHDVVSRMREMARWIQEERLGEGVGSSDAGGRSDG